MKEKTLLKIALITSLVGLVVIYIISGNIVIEEKTLEKITLDNKDEFVKVRGIVSRVTDLEKVTIMEITRKGMKSRLSGRLTSTKAKWR